MIDNHTCVITASQAEDHNVIAGYPASSSKEGFFVLLTAPPSTTPCSATSTLMTALPTSANINAIGLLLEAHAKGSLYDQVALPEYNGIVKVAVKASGTTNVIVPFTFGMLDTDGSVIPYATGGTAVKVCRFIEASGTGVTGGVTELLRATLVEPAIG